MANMPAATVTIALLFFTLVCAEARSIKNGPTGAVVLEPGTVLTIDKAKLTCLRHLAEVDLEKTCLHRVKKSLLKRGRVSFFELAIWPGCCKAFDKIRSKYPADRCRETVVGQSIGEADTLIQFMYCSLNQ